MKLKIALLTGLFCFCMSGVKSQSDTIVDYLNYKFRYIDSDYKIHIDSATFDSSIVKYNFFRNRITRYQDSIVVVVMWELNDWMACNAAKVQLGFTWLRAGYYCWLSEREAKDLAFKSGYKHPWRFYQAFMNPENKNPKINKLIKSVDKKLHRTYPEIVTKGLTRKEFFLLALKNNPVRIEDEKKLKASGTFKSMKTLMNASKSPAGNKNEDKP